MSVDYWMRAAIVLIVLVWLVLIVFFIKTDRSKKPSSLREWRLLAYGGGAPITYDSETKQAAIDYCAKTHGAVMFVDETNAMIFYKPPGFTKPT